MKCVFNCFFNTFVKENRRNLFPMKLQCIVVDDSSIQRMIITKLVKNHQNLNLVGDFSNAIEAKSCMSIHHVDLIFLDIEMPVIDGFDFLDGLKSKPQIIFITAKADYAVKAFDYDATDYLQKPISLARFDSVVKRALLKYTIAKENEEDDDFIFIKSNLKKMKIYTNRIKWIEAFGDYVKVITEDESHMVLATMKSFEKDLPKEKFLRVHKSFIVNIEKIERYNSKFAEIGMNKIPLSRNKKDDLRKALTFD